MFGNIVKIPFACWRGTAQLVQKHEKRKFKMAQTTDYVNHLTISF